MNGRIQALLEEPEENAITLALPQEHEEAVIDHASLCERLREAYKRAEELGRQLTSSEQLTESAKKDAKHAKESSDSEAKRSEDLSDKAIEQLKESAKKDAKHAKESTEREAQRLKDLSDKEI